MCCSSNKNLYSPDSNALMLLILVWLTTQSTLQHEEQQMSNMSPQKQYN